jgi:uncharacterized protein (DUF3084 family)
VAVTDALIFAAADELKTQGLKPTLAEVREVLGAGSYSTISTGMRKWRAHANNKHAGMEVPEPIQQELTKAGCELWTVAQRLAEAAWNGEREEMLRAQADLEREQSEAAEVASQATREVETLTARLAQLTDQLERVLQERDILTADLQQLGTEHLILIARLADQERHLCDLNAELSRVNELSSRLLAVVGPSELPLTAQQG